MFDMTNSSMDNSITDMANNKTPEATDEKWQHAASLQETNRRLLLDEVMCDVTFVLGDSRSDAKSEVNASRSEVKSHKCILASRSPVFYAMFCGPLAESSSEVAVPDIQPDIFKLFLEGLYTGCLAITAETVMMLLYASKKYDTPCLKAQCNKYLDENLNFDNVCTVLDQALTFDERPLTRNCLNLVTKETRKVLKSEAFNALSKAGLKAILELERMNCSEDKVYLACKKWAGAYCKRSDLDFKKHANLREALGDTLQYIRFPIMDIAVFSEKASQDGILTADEKTAIFQDIVLGKSTSYFNSIKRCKGTKQLLAYRFKNIKAMATLWKHGGKVDAINFNVNTNVLLTGVVLFLPTQNGSKLVSGKLRIYKGDQLLHEQQVTMEHFEGKQHECIRLTKCLEIVSHTDYTIEQALKGNTTYYGEKEIMIPVQDGVQVVFLGGKSENGTGIGIGQIYGVELEYELGGGANPTADQSDSSGDENDDLMDRDEDDHVEASFSER